MGLVPSDFDPEYSLEEINSHQQLITDRNNNATIPLFCTFSIIFQNHIK
jgi:hypothetical protein